MSTTASFQSIVYFGSQEISVFAAKKTGWKFVESFAHDGKASAKAKKLLSDSVLILVSDGLCGHLQVLFPNKKSELADAKVAEVLEKEYEIDTQAYEFASQKFTLSREQVQMSISGIEREIYQKIQDWIAPFSPKKTWVMPFGWFVSALKSVEPVLLAVALSESEILISHHYLGVDDARELDLKDLAAYVKARKNERKETHLLYVQADTAVQKKIMETLGDSVATHELVKAEEGQSVLEAILDAVTAKGDDAVAELLHFDLEVSSDGVTPAETEVPESSESDEDEVDENEATDLNDAVDPDESENTEETDTEEDILPASDLPKPNLPEMASEEAEETELVSADDADETDSDDEPVTQVAITETVSRTVVVDTDDVDESDSDATEDEPHKPSAPAQKEDDERETAPPQEVAALHTSKTVKTVTNTAPDSTASPNDDDSSEDTDSAESSFFADYHSSGVARASESRYVEVPKKSSWKTAILVFVGVVLLTSIVGGAVFWSQQSLGEQQSLLPATSPTPSPTPLIEAEPEATESAAMADLLTDEEKEGLSVLVLNALGVPGLAGDTQDELEAAGWTDVSVGNASGSYEGAIFVATENEQVLATLEDDLDIEVTPATDISEPGSNQYDVVFIIADEVPWQ